MKPSYGVIVGRFQVHELHDGHLELFRQVRNRHQRVIVLLGCAPTGLTKRNPLDFDVRRRMIQAKFPEFTVVPVQDKKTDELWSKEVDARIRDIVTYGDVQLYNAWPNDELVTVFKNGEVLVKHTFDQIRERAK